MYSKYSLFRGGGALIALFFLIPVFTGCDTGTGNDPDDDPVIETIVYQPDGDGYYQFYTNDEQYYGHYFWSASQDIGTGNLDRTVTVKKNSGNKDIPYGFAFDVNHSDYGESTEGCFFGITLSGDWLLVDENFDDSDMNTALGYGTTGAINGDYGAENSFQIQMDRANDKVTITVNGTTVVDQAGYTDCGGQYAVLLTFIGDSSQEDFPNVPVDVRYQ